MKKLINYCLVLVLVGFVYSIGFVNGVEFGIFGTLKDKVKSFVKRDFICYPIVVVEKREDGQFALREEIRCRLKF